jgi:hypothetical protein
MSAPAGGVLTFDKHKIGVHARDVMSAQTQYASGVSSAEAEAVVTDLALGTVMGVTLLPAVALLHASFFKLAHGGSEALHDTSIRITATAEAYGATEEFNTQRVEKSPTIEGNSIGEDFKPHIADAGIFGNAVKFGRAGGEFAKGEGDGLDLFCEGAAFALDIVGMVLDPAGSLVGGVAGFIIDLCWPLKELLDLTIGDPNALETASNAWDQLARWFVDVDDTYQTSLQALDRQAWDGEAADHYRELAGGTIGAIAKLANHCETISLSVLAVGSLIGELRSQLFDLVTGYVIDQIIAGTIALSFAGPTFGASVVAWLEEAGIDAELKGVAMAFRIEASLLRLAAAAHKAIEQSHKFDEFAAKLDS